MEKNIETPQKSQQVIKTRDDPFPVLFEREASATEPEKPFRVSSETQHGWARGNGNFGPETLRPRIEPWLTALFQSEHLSLLVGSGLSQAVHIMAAGKPSQGMAKASFGVFDEEISSEAARVAKCAGRQDGNFEDQIRVANELLRGLEILPQRAADGTIDNSESCKLRDGIKGALEGFAGSILQSEQSLAGAATDARQRAFNYLVSFLMSFASRSGTRERLNIYTTNYDRYIEAGADVAGLRLIDRFVGTLAPVFRASRLDIDFHYSPPGIRGEPRYLEGVARFTKLHGSIDWVDHDGAIRRIGLPFGAQDASPFLTAMAGPEIDARQLMIYPNSAKDRETSDYPYVELFRDLATSICRPNSTLVCYGYSLGDEHINRVIEDMLTIPSTHLVVISYDDPLGRVMETYDRLGKSAQVTLLVGDHLGDLQTLVDRYLPKSAIDLTTVRMAELLRARWTTNQPETAPVPGGASTATSNGASNEESPYS